MDRRAAQREVGTSLPQRKTTRMAATTGRHLTIAMAGIWQLMGHTEDEAVCQRHHGMEGMMAGRRGKAIRKVAALQGDIATDQS